MIAFMYKCPECLSEAALSLGETLSDHHPMIGTICNRCKKTNYTYVSSVMVGNNLEPFIKMWQRRNVWHAEDLQEQLERIKNKKETK